ncbi:metallophosphoesterase (plasmid) [Pseudomonas sp. FeN3W]|nr:metallophosphoesterase [Pseudomonas sp. FeN3W]
MKSTHLSPIKRLGPNLKGKVYAVSDVHGHISLLEHLLDRAGFDEKYDWLIICGDLVDRGPESHRFMEFIERPWVHALIGNHEDFCRQSGLTGITPLHLKSGGEWFTKIAYSERSRIIDAINEMPYAIDLTHSDGRRIGFVHAEVVGDDWDDFLIMLENQEAHLSTPLLEKVLFSRVRIYVNQTQPIGGVDQLFVGHTSLYDPVVLGNTHYIDTGTCYSDGVMTLVCIDDDEIFQCGSKGFTSYSRMEMSKSPAIRDRSLV